MPKVSVIIPAYNAEATVLKTINSVLQQTLTDFEIVVINDGSTDNTLKILESVVDPRVRVYSFQNAGLPTARNRGIDHSRGKYVTFIDADDLWVPDKLESQTTALDKSPEAGVVYSWTLTMSENEAEFHPGKSATFEGNVLPNLLVGNFIASGSNVMIRREAIEQVGQFAPELKSSEDWDYWLRLAAKWEFVVVPKPQILYRQSSNSMSSKVKVMEKYHFIVHERAFKAAPAELQYLEPKARSNYYLYVAQLSLRHVKSWKNILFAFSRLVKALKIYPRSLAHKYVVSLLAKIFFLIIFTPYIGKQALNTLSKLKSEKKISTSPQKS